MMMRLAFALVLCVGTAARAEVAIQEITTDGGVNAWLVEEHAIPFVALEIHFDGGSALDAADKRGAINLMTALLEEGSGDMDAQTFQTALESLAASFSFSVYDDGMGISARFLTENSDEAVTLLRQALVEPRFDQDAIDRVRGQVLSIIASDASNPGRIASRAFFAGAFGDHPYGSSQDGTAESVAALTREDMRAAHRDVLVRGRAVVSAVGDITADELSAIVDQLLGDLPQDGPPLPPDVAFGLGGGLDVIDFDTPQSVAYFGHEGIKRDDPDFFAAYILNTILGGSGPQSVLMEEVREKRGLTYGVYSYLVPRTNAQMVIGSLGSSNDRMAEAIAVVRDEWRRIATGGITQEQLDEAKTYLTGEYPLRFDGNAKIAGIMIGMQVQGLPADYVINRNDYINAVTLDDIHRVAARILRPDNLYFTVVGRPVGLASGD